MGKIKIYIKLVDGVLEYRDSESQHGKSIITSVDPGDTVIWKLDKCSGISEITKVIINESTNFFSEGPEKIDFDEFKAEVSKHATGRVIYELTVVSCIKGEAPITLKFNANVAPRTDPPAIVVKPK